jgi:hypothetical protein
VEVSLAGVTGISRAKCVYKPWRKSSLPRPKPRPTAVKVSMTRSIRLPSRPSSSVWTRYSKYVIRMKVRKLESDLPLPRRDSRHA